MIRDHLDIGRPGNVVLIFDRKLRPNTPGKFSTKVITRGVDPQLSCTYKSARLKQYFKGGRALRTETVIADTRDFGIGRRVCATNWRALRAVGNSANQRLCDAQAADARPAPDVVTLARVTRPTNENGLHAPGLRFGEPRVMALLTVLLQWQHLLGGFRNQQLVRLMSALLDQHYTNRQATYDLRRLRRKGLIVRRSSSHTYQVTPYGRQVATLFTKAHMRVLAPGLALLAADLPAEIAARSPVATTWRKFDTTLELWLEKQLTAA